MDTYILSLSEWARPIIEWFNPVEFSKNARNRVHSEILTAIISTISFILVTRFLGKRERHQQEASPAPTELLRREAVSEAKRYSRIGNRILILNIFLILIMFILSRLQATNTIAPVASEEIKNLFYQFAFLILPAFGIYYWLRATVKWIAS